MNWSVIPPQQEGWYWIEFRNSAGNLCQGMAMAYSPVKGGPIDTAFWDGENVPVFDERIQRWAGPVLEPTMEGKTVVTMPELQFRLVLVSSDGREITFPSAEIVKIPSDKVEILGEFHDTLFLRFKRDSRFPPGQIEHLLKQMKGECSAKCVCILPWDIDLIKLVPVR